MKTPMLKGFEVETCVHVPLFPDGSCDLDKADYRVTEVKTLPEAMRLAKELLPNDFFGSVRVTEFEREEVEYGYWSKEYIGETQHIERYEEAIA